MTFWDFWTNNRVKILGSLATLVAGMLSLIALGMFNGSETEPALLDPVTIRWMTIVLSLLNLLLGGSTVAAGVSNTTKERIAVAQAKTATAMETALHTTKE